MQIEKNFLDNTGEIEYPVFRSKRTSQHQYEVMVSFLETHPELAAGKTTETFTKGDRQRLWQELADTLNKFPGGPRKSNQQWRKTWNDLKCSARAKAIGSKRQHSEIESKAEHLTPIEKKVLAMSKFNGTKEGKSQLENTNSNLMDIQNNDVPNGKDNISSDSDIQSESRLTDITSTLLQWSSINNAELDENLLSNHANDNATELQNNHLNDASVHNETDDVKPSIAHLTETIINGDIADNVKSSDLAESIENSNPVESTESNDLDDDIEALFSTRSKNESNKRQGNSDTTRRTEAVEGLTFIEKEKSIALSRIADAKEKLLLVEQKKLQIAREHLEIKRKKLELSREQYYLNERVTVAEENKAKAFSIVAEILRSRYNL